MVADGGQGDPPPSLTGHTQGLLAEQGGSQGLQFAPSDPWGWGRTPLGAHMGGAAWGATRRTDTGGSEGHYRFSITTRKDRSMVCAGLSLVTILFAT